MRPLLRTVLVMLVAAMGMAAAPAWASRVTEVSLETKPGMTRVSIQADGPLDYQVELAGPQEVVVHMPGGALAASLPAPLPGSILQELVARPSAEGLDLIIATNAPGVTVLPLYQAAARRLVLELGGEPALEGEASPAATAGPTAKGAIPQEDGSRVRRPIPAEPPPVDGAAQEAAVQTAPPAPPAPPALEDEPPAPLLGLDETPATATPATGETAAAPAPAPAAAPRPVSLPPQIDQTAQPPASPGDKAPTVTGVRMGTHADYTRVVFDGDAPLFPRFTADDTKATLALKRGVLAPGARLGDTDQRVLGIQVAQAEPLVLELTLAQPLASHKLFFTDGGRKVVLDLGLMTPEQAASWRQKRQEELARAQAAPQPEPPAAAPPPAPAPQATATAQPVAAQAAAAPEAPAGEQPRVVVIGPQSGPVTPQQAARVQAAAQPTAPTAPEQPPTASQRLAQRAAVLSAELPRAAKATHYADDPAFVKGQIPAIPPPAPVARPRGQMQAADRAAPPGDQSQVLAKVRQQSAQEKEPAIVVGSGGGVAPGPTPGQERPAQGATLGPKGRMEIQAQRVFAVGKDQLDNRQYEQALNSFERFLEEYPDSRLAPEAQFRVADAFYYLNEQNIAPVYDEAMERYQKAIDLYPQNDQVPWALLMMGRAAMAAEEPFKAGGYFELVATDYPQSDYAPLALVEKGKAYLAQNLYKEAYGELEKVASNYPQSRYRKQAEWYQALSLFGMGRYERASFLLLDMKKRYPQMYIEEPELLYYIGEAEFQLRSYDKAREYFLWALNLLPTLRDADIIMARVGDTYRYGGDFAAAQDIYRQVINNFPGTDGALVAQLRMAESPAQDRAHPAEIFQVAATTDALKVYQELAEKYPERPVAELARLKLGVFFFKKKEYAQSIAVLEKLINDYPDTQFRGEATYTLDLAAMALIQRYREADKPLELMDAYLRNRVLLRRPNGNEVFRMLAWAYQNAQLPERAANLYKILLSRGLTDPELYYDLARAQLDSGQATEAAETLGGKIDKLPPSLQTPAKSLLGRSLVAASRYPEGAAFLNTLLQAEPDHAGAAQDWLVLAQAYQKMDQPSEALIALLEGRSRLEKAEPKPEPQRLFLVTLQIAKTAREVYNHKLALDNFARALTEAPSDQGKAQTLYETAMTYRAMGDTKQLALTLDALVKMKVDPWSGMAEGLIRDLELAQQLATVGK